MFSFKSLAIVSALALGAATAAFAAPLESTNVLARCDCNSVAVIIDDVTVAVTPIINELYYITADNCTVEVLTPIINDVKTVISGAIGEVNKLVGQPAAVILATVDGAAQITVEELAQLVSTLLILVFGALGAVLNVAGAAVIGLVIPLLAAVGEVVGALVVAILHLTSGLLSGLLGVVLGLIGEVVGVILRLNVTTLIYTLAISL